MAVDSGAPEAPNVGAATGSAVSSEMAVSPSSAASSNYAPFTPSEIPGMAMDASALDPAFGSDIGNAAPLQLYPDGSSRDSRSLGQLWNFSLSDLTVDLTSLGGNLLARNLPYVHFFCSWAHPLFKCNISISDILRLKKWMILSSLIGLFVLLIVLKKSQ
jgi:hypothetical protein